MALLATLLAAAAAISGCDKQSTTEALAANSVTDANVADKVDQATTAADHQAIAAYYDARAQSAQRQFAEDGELQERYERRWQQDSHHMGSGPRGHIGDLRRGHETDAQHYQSMAAWHREMARASEGPDTPRE